MESKFNDEELSKKAKEIWEKVSDEIEDDEILVEDLKIKLIDEVIDVNLEEEDKLLIIFLMDFVEEIYEEIKEKEGEMLYR